MAPMSTSSIPQEQGDSRNGLLTIGAMAKACGVTVRTLRYYEEMDLIGPVRRTAGKYRLYNDRSLKRVRAILALQDLNYSLEQILAALGPYTESLSYNKEERIHATRESLARQEKLISGKLVSLQKTQQEIVHRIKLLDDVCEPCYEKEPERNCDDCCEYRDIHLS